MRLKDKVALITGGGSGIGAAIAQLFAKEGASVAITGRRREALNKVAKNISYAGGKVISIPGDVTVETDVQNAAQSTLDQFGHIDILINSAGNLFHAGPLHETTDAIWDETFNIFLKGTFRYARALIPHMLAQKNGVIVNIGSVAGMKAFPWAPLHAYSAAKAGIIMLTKTLAIEYAKHNIRCNCICPGGVDTPGAASLFNTPEARAAVEATHPIGHMGQPDDIAQAALYLVSDEAAWVTGTILTVDGGIMAQ